ncbi:hypothetical protein [Streptomyces longwoodensis]
MIGVGVGSSMATCVSRIVVVPVDGAAVLDGAVRAAPWRLSWV